MKFNNGFGIALALAATAAQAQPLPSTPEGRERWFNARGDELIRSSPAEAAQFYLRAHDEVADCVMLHNAGVAFERAGNLERAIANLRLYLASDPRTCPSLRVTQTATTIRTALERLEREYAQRQREPSLPAPPAPVLTLVQPHPRPPVVFVSPPRVVGMRPEPTATEYRLERSSPALSYTLWGIGGLAIGFGIYSLVVGSNENSLAGQAGVDDPGRHARASSAATTGGAVSLTIGMLSAAGGALWYAFRPSNRVAITPQVTAQYMGLSAHVRF